MPNGTLVVVTTSLQPVVVAILPMLLLVVEYVSFRNGHGVVLMPIVMFLVLHMALYLFGYLPERKRAIELVQKVLGGDETLARSSR